MTYEAGAEDAARCDIKPGRCEQQFIGNEFPSVDGVADVERSEAAMASRAGLRQVTPQRDPAKALNRKRSVWIGYGRR